MTRRILVLAAALTIGLAPAQLGAQGRGRARGNQADATRFAGMDRNNDGRITRSEWQGSDQSFQQQDWNHDGVLSGDEIGNDFEFDDWTAQGFSGLDRNRDNRITSDEWTFNRESFLRADHNHDGVVSRSEFLSESAINDGTRTNGTRTDRFDSLDRNRDNRISRSEWLGTFSEFDALDRNNDDYLSRTEIGTTQSTQSTELFRSLDVNRDGAISRSEWRSNLGDFNHFDLNRDQRLTRAEFENEQPYPQRTRESTAFRAGYERGLVEGRQAGVEDRVNKHGWDLEGQRELESANSGYTSPMGPLSDYQAGYREAFRRAYPEGFRG